MCLIDNYKDNKKFFFAEYDAGMYNSTIALTTPFYQQAISILSLLVGEYCINKNGYINLLDIGAGTGNESIKVMKENPNIFTLAIDLCEPMRDEYIRHYQKEFALTVISQFDFIVGDIFKTTNDELLRHIGNDKFQIIISAYVLHHYTKELKNDLFQRIYDLLDSNGIFINMDLFSFDSCNISELTDRKSFEFIETEFKNPSEEFPSAQDVPLEERLRLMDLWIKHYKEDNILTPIEEQVRNLKDIGFSQVATPFIYMQNGLIWAKK